MHLFRISLTEPELLDALVVELVRGYSFEETLEQVYKQESKQLAISQAVIARAPVSAPIDPESVRRLVHGEITTLPPELHFLGIDARDIEKSFARFPGRPVHLLFSYDYRHHLSQNINPNSTVNPLNASAQAPGNVIKKIQITELEIIVEFGRARFPPIPGVYYEAPNGRLVRSFLRIGNIQRSRAVVDALFFWLLPYLRECSAIITDIWSIGSIALNASRRLASYHGTPERPCPVEMVSSYLDGSQESAIEAADHIERLLRLTAGDHNKERPKVLFLMSAISTGDLHTRVKKMVEQRGIDISNVHFVSLFNLGANTSNIPCLVDWSTQSGDGTFAPVDRTAVTGRIETIKIDPQTYFPTSYRDVGHVIRARELQSFREFLDRYHDMATTKVHHNVTDDGATRHHAISIDTVRLCSHPTFKKRLIDRLLQLEPTPRLIITPVHDAGKILADVALAALRNKEPNVEHLMHPDLILTDDRTQENTRILALINGVDDQSAILILDDAFITGRRLNHYQLALRHVRFRGRIHYLVAVARPEALSAWEYRCRMLKARPVGSAYSDLGNTVSAIEAFVLPDWDEADCPWCREVRIYQGFASLSPTLRERRQLLEQHMHTGLSDNLFLTPPGVMELSFTSDSKFAALGTSEASVYASVASGVQSLRSPEYEARAEKPALGPRHYPVATVLDHTEYLFGTYTDSLLRACVLRAARDFELVYADRNTERAKTQRAIELITSTSAIEHDVSAEILIATLENKFPELHLSTEPPMQAIHRLRLSEMFGDLLNQNRS